MFGVRLSQHNLWREKRKNHLIHRAQHRQRRSRALQDMQQFSLSTNQHLVKSVGGGSRNAKDFLAISENVENSHIVLASQPMSSYGGGGGCVWGGGGCKKKKKTKKIKKKKKLKKK